MITIGADPELFAANKDGFVCAHGLIPGTKAQPKKVPDGAIQVDGMALEFNIDPVPYDDYKAFQNKLDSVMGSLASFVKGYHFLESVTIQMTKEYKESLPLEATQIGCNPDINAYTEDLNEAPDEHNLFRSAGGHIHVGGIFNESMSEVERFSRAVRLARLMDKHLGVYSLLWDKSVKRREIYGKAGACRFKPYGMEYRTLSNKWIFNKAITRFVFFQTKASVLALERGEDVKDNFYRDIIDGSQFDHDFFKTDFLSRVIQQVLSK
jgi:hypothetical protein